MQLLLVQWCKLSTGQAISTTIFFLCVSRPLLSLQLKWVIDLVIYSAAKRYITSWRMSDNAHINLCVNLTVKFYLQSSVIIRGISWCLLFGIFSLVFYLNSIFVLLIMIMSKRIFTALKSQWTSKGTQHFRKKNHKRQTNKNTQHPNPNQIKQNNKTKQN